MAAGDGFSERDRCMMREALALAAKGLYSTEPNPRVGCIVTDAEGIAGRGYHRRAGEAHAEIHALSEAGARARGATAYVTLEPCCHTGRTGPCTEALIAAGVRRVVFAHEDPNPEVAGAGARQLRAAGIEVRAGLLREEARALNPGYLQRIEQGRPFLRSKIAASLDGRTALASGESKWITGPQARADVQRWRARSSAILTGIGTVLEDDPRLDVRLEEAQEALVQPARVILDTRLRLPASARMLASGGPIHVFHACAGAAPEGVAAHRLHTGEGSLDLAAVMTRLAELGFNEVLVEAGSVLNGALLRAGLIDELVLYLAPRLLGEGARALAAIGRLQSMNQSIDFEIIEMRQIGTDARLVLRPAVRQEVV